MIGVIFNNMKTPFEVYDAFNIKSVYVIIKKLITKF